MKKLLKSFKTLALIFFLLIEAANAKTVKYQLIATEGNVNLSGKKSVDFGLMLNGQIPAPTLEFTEGDNAEIVLKNQISNEEVSVHWHGILLPSDMDGVPYVNTPPIKPGESFTFRFKIRQNGTYWYHSHTNVQEQKGIYGAIVIHPKEERIKYDKDLVVVLSDWSDENASDILKNLRKDGEYYLYKKGTMRSWLGAIQAGKFRNYLTNEWTRMGGMDFSDVGYDAFLINGKKESLFYSVNSGEKIRLRIINASASTYFYISLAQDNMKVISADGKDISPVLAKELLIGVAETYDILFQVPDNNSYELKATAQDGTGTTSAWIGKGKRVYAPEKPFPDMYATMSHGKEGGHESHGNDGLRGQHLEDYEQNGHHRNHEDQLHSNHVNHNQGHNKNSKDPSELPGNRLPIGLLTVDNIKSDQNTELSDNAPVHEVRLELDGDMNRYIWFINGKSIHEERTIEIKEGEKVKFTFVNKTMMHHPMHLHGHFFRVLNQNGAYSPLKHTVDVPPHTARIIEFIANEPGEWMLHCHNLYHLKTGMARVIKYSTYTPKPSIIDYQKYDPHLHDHWYLYGTAEVATNHTQASLQLSQTWNQLETRIETRNTAGKNFSFREPWEIEGDLFYRRWFSRFFSLVGGGTFFDQNLSAVVGVGYILPFLIRSNLFVNQRGMFRLDLDKRLQWTKTVFSDVDFTWRPAQAHALGTAVEYEISLMYSPVWTWSAGLMLTNRNIGFGAQIQF